MRNIHLMLVLMLGSMMALSGCSTKPIVKPQETMFIAVPNDLLMQLPVKRVETPTVRGLADAYVDNTIQLGIANKRLELIKKWNTEQRAVHEENPK